jgi:hypothetical protein
MQMTCHAKGGKRMAAPLIDEVQPRTATERMSQWMSTELACIAGRREFAKGRYAIADLATESMPAALAQFEEEVRQLRKVALLCLIPRNAANMDPRTPSIEVLREISTFGASICAAEAEALLHSAVLERPVRLDCPVTGVPTTYSFFGVAFCPQAANAEDDLYDLPLSAPFPCINITSDGFAFAMFVRDMSVARHGVAPHGIASRAQRLDLFADCVMRWQKFSMHTLSAFTERTRGTRCPVRVSEDGLSWQAAHNDPVFAETTKELHTHEMPRVYAADLAGRWNAVLDRQSAHFHARSGQSGGLRLGSPPRGGGCPFAAASRRDCAPPAA